MKTLNRKTMRFWLPLALCAGLAGGALAHDHPAAGGKPQAGAPKPEVSMPESSTRDARTYFTDLELLTHEGRKVRFYTDMLEGRTVLINTIYTNCKDACPLILQALNQVRALIGEHFGRDVVFITLSSDPERDSPAALRTLALKQNVDLAGWTFLTGSKGNVDHVLKKLGMYSPDIEGHSTLLIAGNVPAKRWTKIRPDAPPQAIAERLRQLIAVDGKPVPLPH